jgi:hypothetical protein
LRQAESDVRCGNAVFTKTDDSTYCHALAKYQQAVEKGVKSLLHAAADAGLTATRPRRRHEVSHEVSALIHLANRRGADDLATKIHGSLGQDTRGEITALCGFAPGPDDTRNTEYPYPDDDGSWRSPCDPGSFVIDEVERFRRFAERFLQNARLIVSAAEHTPRPRRR